MKLKMPPHIRGIKEIREQLRLQQEDERAEAVKGLDGMSDGRIRRHLAKIYQHLPGDMIKQITKIYLKHHR